VPDWSRWFYDLSYRFWKPDWDTGLTPPEVIAEVENGRSPGRALDLGCGTGTHAIYLAQHGFSVVGVDFSPKAIEMARQKAANTGATVDFRVGDVTRLDFLREPFNLILDVGCFHGLDADRRARYATHLTRLTHAGSTFLLFAFDRPIFRGLYGVTPDTVGQTFEPQFTLEDVKRSANRHGRGTAWYRLVRR
jgi:SAM-dependent methyltransferase